MPYLAYLKNTSPELNLPPYPVPAKHGKPKLFWEDSSNFHFYFQNEALVKFGGWP